jgi:hypothetical protein
MYLPESEQEHVMTTSGTTVEEKIEQLDKLFNLLIKIQSSPAEFIRKQDVMQHLEWAMSHLADSIWQETHN